MPSFAYLATVAVLTPRIFATSIAVSARSSESTAITGFRFADSDEESSIQNRTISCYTLDAMPQSRERPEADPVSQRAGLLCARLRRDPAGGNVSQQKLAVKIGRDRNWVQRLESGYAPVDLEMVQKLADAFRVDATRLAAAILEDRKPTLTQLRGSGAEAAGQPQSPPPATPSDPNEIAKWVTDDFTVKAAWLTEAASRAAIKRVLDGLYLLDQRARLGRPQVVFTKRGLVKGMKPLRGRKTIERVLEGKRPHRRGRKK